MSVKFEKDTVKTTMKEAATQVGNAVTGGKGGANGYLAVSRATLGDMTMLKLNWLICL